MKSESNLEGIRAVILAGGKGTRLLPYTTVLPKPLMPVGDLPILEILIRRLRAAGVRDLTLAVGYLASLLEAYFGNGDRWGVQIDYSMEKEPLGTAGPIGLVKGLDKTFLVMNGDLLTNLDFRDMVRQHRGSGAIVTVGLYTKKIKIDLGVIKADGRGVIHDYVEKPVLNYEVSIGMYVMEPAAMEFIPPGAHVDLPDLIKALIGAGKPVHGYRYDGFWLDIGRHDDYAQAAEVFERERHLFLGPED